MGAVILSGAKREEWAHSWLGADRADEDRVRDLLRSATEVLTGDLDGSLDHLNASGVFVGSESAGCVFEGISLQHATFAGAALVNVSFINCDLSGADFAAARLVGCQFLGSPENVMPMSKANFGRAIVEDCTFAHVDLSQPNFWRAYLGARERRPRAAMRFFCSRLDDGMFEASYLHRVDFDECSMKACDFSNSTLLGTKFVCDREPGELGRCTFTGSSIRSSSGRPAEFMGVDMSGGFFDRVEVIGTEEDPVVFCMTRLTSATFQGTTIRHASFRAFDPSHDGQCENLNLDLALVQDATFDRLRLTAMSSRATTFQRAVFETCRLENADLSNSLFIDCEFIACTATSSAWSGGVFRSEARATRFRGGMYENASFDNVSMTKCRIEGLDSPIRFRSSSWHHSTLRDCVVRRADFMSARMARFSLSAAPDAPDPELHQCDMRRADLNGADLAFCHIASSSFRDADLSSAVLVGASAAGVELEGASLRGAFLLGADMIGARMHATDLSEAHSLPLPLLAEYMVTTSGMRPSARQVSAAGSQQPSVVFVRRLYERRNGDGDPDGWMNFFDSETGAPAAWWRTILRGASLQRASLHGANMVNVDLTEANLSEANALGAYFRGSLLAQATLRDSNLQAAVFGASAVALASAECQLIEALPAACLKGVDFTGASLPSARLGYCCLTGVTFDGTDLEAAQFEGAVFSGSKFRNARFKGCADFGKIWNLTGELGPRGARCRCCQTPAVQEPSDFSFSAIEGVALAESAFAELRMMLEPAGRVGGKEEPDVPVRESWVAWKNNFQSIGYYDLQSSAFVREKVWDGVRRGGALSRSIHRSLDRIEGVRSHRLAAILSLFPTAVLAFVFVGMQVAALTTLRINVGGWHEYVGTWGRTANWLVLAGVGLLTMYSLVLSAGSRNAILRMLYDYGESLLKIVVFAAATVIGYWVTFVTLGPTRSLFGASMGAFYPPQTPFGYMHSSLEFFVANGPAATGIFKFLGVAESITGIALSALLVFTLARRTAGR